MSLESADSERIRLDQDDDRAEITRGDDQPYDGAIVAAGVITSGGTNDVQVVKLNGPPTAGSFTLAIQPSTLIAFSPQTTGAIAYNASAATVAAALNPIARTQKLHATGTISGGTFKLSGTLPASFTTAAIPYNATAALVAAALHAALPAYNFGAIGGDLPNDLTIGFDFAAAVSTMTVDNTLLTGGGSFSVSASSSNVVGTGGPLPDAPVTLTFSNQLANSYQPRMTVDGSSLTGGWGKITHPTYGEAVLPTNPNTFFLVRLQNVTGAEAAGAAAVLAPGRLIRAFNVGDQVPQAGDTVLVATTPQRWVFRYG